MPSVKRYYRRLFGSGLAICAVGMAVGIILQQIHYRGQAGLILAILSGMLGVFCIFSLLMERP